MGKTKVVLKKTDVIELCTKERSNTKWRFFKLANLRIFAAPLRDIPMGCKDAVLPKSLLKSHTVICPTYEQNTKKPCKDNFCLLRALAPDLQGNERLEVETSKIFNLFFINSTNPVPSKLQGVCMEDFLSVEDIVGMNFFIYDIDLIDGAWFGKLHDEASKITRWMCSWYDIIVIFVTSTMFLHSSRLSAVQLAMHFSKRLETWTVTWSDPVNEWSIHIQKMCSNTFSPTAIKLWQLLLLSNCES